MKKTKELYSNRISKAVHSILLCFVFVFIVLQIYISELHIACASDLVVYNHVTQDRYTYSGTKVKYTVNGTSLSIEHPGLILANGAAVGPYKEVFEDTLGVTTDYSQGKKSFNLFYGPHTISMTLGNTEVTVNGKKQTMNNAPFVYSFNNSSEAYLYVPTRFVAEALGFLYTWDSTTATASIQRPNIIYDGTESVAYTGSNPHFLLNGEKISSDSYPGYFFDNVALFEAKEYFQKTEMAAYTFLEGSGLIVLKTSEHIVRMVIDSPVAYIDDEAYVLDTVPRLITPQDSSTAGVYVPARFVAEALGYTVYYHKANETIRITGYLPDLNPDVSNGDMLLPSDSVVADTASYGKVIFSYETPEQLLQHYKEQNLLVPKALFAYSCINSDALYMKGVNENNVHITDKADVIEITITDYHYPYSGKLCFNPDATFLNYCYLSGTNTIRILIIKTKDLHYYTYSAPDGCVIHFTDTTGMYEDYITFTHRAEEFPENSSGNTEILGKDENLLPEAIFTRNHFVIPLPEGVTLQNIEDYDDYHNKRFSVSIPGNHMNFLSEQDTYNPVATLSDVRFSYKASDNTTVITFYTTKIQGYSLTVAGNFLAVKIADPKDIYDKIIVLDAGHGGIDPGTLRGSLYEKNVNYNVINVYAAEYFMDSDIKVYFTRTTDTKIALQTRADFAATVNADLFISFHVNAHSNKAVSGTSVYYSASNNKTLPSGLKSSVLAKTVVDYLSNAWNTKNRGILTEKFVVIHNNTVPAILVECGFITNDNDYNVIKETNNQKKAAKALFDAVTEIFDKYPTGR